MNNTPHLTLTNADRPGNVPLLRTLRREVTNPLDARARQLRTRIVLSCKGWRPALYRLVAHIVGMSSQKQVIWTHATRIVTLVKNVLAVRDCPVGQAPRYTVGVKHATVNACLSVTPDADTEPRPAALRYFNFTPEARPLVFCED